MSVIKIRNLTKRYTGITAVDGIDLDIGKGEIFGLLGPNGAGKSTTINIICALVKPDNGDVEVMGHDIRKDNMSFKKDIGLVPQEIAIFESLNAKENIAFFAKLSGLKGKELKESIDRTLEFTGLVFAAGKYPKEFSGGMKRRLNIACAIVHRPKIIIMDEPTVGIDPQSRNHILESVRMLNREGSTVIYTSHYMEEVQSICTNIAIMDKGSIVAKGTKEELLSLSGGREKLVVECMQDSPELDLSKINIPGIIKCEFNDGRYEIIAADTQSVLQDIIFVLSRNEIRIKNIDIQQPNLEKVFLALTGRDLRD